MPRTAAPNFAFVTDHHATDVLQVISFRGVEEMSRPYSFQIVLTSESADPDTFEQEVLGAGATLSLDLRGGPEPRRVHGIVRRAEVEGLWGEGDHKRRFRVWLAPRLWLLGRGRNSRIFQDKSVPEIVTAVLAESNVEFTFRLMADYPRRNYCVQHQETDLHFVHRLLAEEGIFFWFEHGTGETDREKVVFGDGPEVCQPLEGGAELGMSRVGGMAADGAIKRFGSSGRVRSGSNLIAQFDFGRPSLDLSARSATKPRPGATTEAPLRTYDHFGALEGEGVGQAAAQLHLEQRRRRAKLAEGESDERRLTPGRRVDISGNSVPSNDGTYTLTRVEHEAYNPEVRGSGAHPAEVYKNRFACLPGDVAPRPKRPKRRVQQVMETATVTGPLRHEIHTDALARVKVQFHWDREGTRSEHSSCWIRTMQPWAGTGWGFQFIPRVGMEVLVLFLSGDTDRPMVVGSAYNAEHPPPFPLPQNKTKSGIRTQSTRDATGFNELSFEDRTGWERVHLHAQKDHDIVVGHDQTNRVGNNRTEEVVGNRFTLVNGNELESIGGNRTESVTGDESRLVQGSRVSTVEGNAMDTVHGTLDARVEAEKHTRIGGSERREVMGESELVVASDVAARIAGNAVTTVGKHDAKRSYILHVEGVTELSGSGKTVLSSDAGIVLQCGETSLTLTSDRIEIASPTIVLAASDASMSLSDEEVILKASSRILGVSEDKVHFVSSGASVKLTDDALVGGGQVKLKAQDSESLDDDDEETAEPTTIELVDQNGDPIPGQRYILVLEGGEERSGVLDADGKATLHDLDADAKVHFPGMADVESN